MENPNNMQPCNPSAATPAPTAAPTGNATATPFGQTPRPTPVGQTPRPSGGIGGPGDAGIGSLAPVQTAVPAWAAALVAVGFIGLLGAFAFVRGSSRDRR